MKNTQLILGIVVAYLISLPLVFLSAVATASVVPSFAPDHIIVKLHEGVHPASVFSNQPYVASSQPLIKGQVALSGLADRLHIVTISPFAMSAVLQALNSNPAVEYAEPDFNLFATLAPNDPSFSSQWGLNNTGQSGGTPDADIDAPEAWDVTTGTGAVKVAVIDTGIDYTHPDLAVNIWTNPGEIAGNNIDDDQNGYIDDIHGYDFANNDGDPADDNSHGTHCAGIIGAIGNNAIGVAGVDWDVHLIALKFLNASGSGLTSDAIRALDYAVLMGAKVSNNSWGGGGFSSSLSQAITSAANSGHIFVAAAGNNGANNDIAPFYPASYSNNNIVSVAATDRYDQLASFSNYGLTSVDLAAPGYSIYSTVPVSMGSYAYKSGTSMATPFAAGAFALLYDTHPTWTYSQIINQVLSSADPLSSLAGKAATGGRLNVFAALTGFFDNNPPITSITSPASGTTYASAQTITISASASDNVGVTKVEFSDGSNLVSTDPSAPYPHGWSFPASNNGTHIWTTKAYDAAGNSGSSAAVNLTVTILTPDTIPPAVSISGPTTVANNNKTFTATASDNVGVTKVEFYLDDATTPLATDTSSPYTTTVSVSGKNAISRGSHTMRAKAYDAAGNSASAQMSFTK